MDTTQHDLKILSMCYYIMAGVNAAYVLLIGAYASLLGAILANLPAQGNRQTVPEFVPKLIGVVAGVLVGLRLLYVACQAGAAWSLLKRRNHALVMTAAILNCMQVPFGTALAVFTFAVLNRAGVRDSFRVPLVPPPPLPPPLP